MSEYGVEVSNAQGIQTLGMQDFTVQKLASMEVPGRSNSGSGIRSDYILWRIPGYDPSKCFLVISPKVYAGYPQNGQVGAWGVLPTYRNAGGEQVAIFTYCNRRRPTGVGGKYTDEWVEHTVHAVIEAVRVA